MLTVEEQAAFLQSRESVRKAAERHMRNNRSQRSIISFVSNLQRGVTQVMQTAIDRGVNISCTAGCCHCCNARVEATPPEIFQIVRELERRAHDDNTAIVDRLLAYVALPECADATWSQRPKCPFLANDLCSIYEIRPSACRKAHSLDVGNCRENAEEIPQDLGSVLGIHALVKGTSDAYQNLGFDAAAYELIGAVLLALADPSAESRWYRGEPVFGSGQSKTSAS